jgi:hypothetical protein
MVHVHVTLPAWSKMISSNSSVLNCPQARLSKNVDQCPRAKGVLVQSFAGLLAARLRHQRELQPCDRAAKPRKPRLPLHDRAHLLWLVVYPIRRQQPRAMALPLPPDLAYAHGDGENTLRVQMTEYQHPFLCSDSWLSYSTFLQARSLHVTSNTLNSDRFLVS